MTDNGTFIINGTERVIVSQLHRSPGVFFESANNRTTSSAKSFRTAAPGWNSNTTPRTFYYVRIDRKRKFLGSIFLARWV